MPTSNTASHDNHEKINSWVSFCYPYMGCLWSSAWRPFGPPKLRYNCLGLTDEDNLVSRTDNFVNVKVFNTVTSARVLSYRWVLHYFSTIPVGGIKIVTIYKRSIFQVEWLIATLILCISHCSESDSVSSHVFYSVVSTALRFLFFLVLSVSRPKLPLGLLSSPDDVIISQLQAISQLFSSYLPSGAFCQVSKLTIQTEHGRL